jgi:hypothetical protein
MPNLYAPSYPPTWEVPTPILKRNASSTSVIRTVTYAFNPGTSDFVVDGNGDVPLTGAAEAAITWAAKATTTQRGAHLIYSRTYGTDIRRSLLAGSHQQIQNALTAEMRRAVKRDSRISDLTEFQFLWEHTLLSVAYRVVLVNGQSKRTVVTIPLS